MFKNYIKTAWRNIVKEKAYSIINVLGLSVAMAVVLLITFWITNEITFNRYHKNHKYIAQVMKTMDFNGNHSTDGNVQVPMAHALRTKYGQYFKDVAMISGGGSFLLSNGSKNLSRIGIWTEAGFPSMFSFKAVTGSLATLHDPSSILISQSTATALFGNADPVNKTITLNNKENFTITAVYEDLPKNSDMRVDILLPWKRFISIDEYTKNNANNWYDHSWSCFVQLNENANMSDVSKRIKKIVPRNPGDKNVGMISLHPMDKWHLYDEFDKDGKAVNGRIRYVWMFGIIGFFILMLACINFMNLSTARSEKRAKEVGIRKTVGSRRGQLISQFFTESLLVVFLSLLLSLIWIQVSLRFFNTLAETNISVPWQNSWFWISLILFVSATAIFAGIYPAFYLSGFKPIVVLKGVFKPGKHTVRPRQILVVVQFVFSIAFTIGTIIVFKQINYAKNRPIGYTPQGLIMVNIAADELGGHYNALRNDLLNSGTVSNIARSTCPTTWVCSDRFGFEWEGKDPNSSANFGTVGISADYGKTINWRIKAGRDFSKDLKTDSAVIIVNEAASKMIGEKESIGKIVRDNGTPYTVIGVIEDMIMNSPYNANIGPVAFFLNGNRGNMMIIRVNPSVAMALAISKIESIFKKYHPSAPFQFDFNDEAYANKFAEEKRIGNLALFFTLLAIFISCLGLFGLAAFVAEQRTKEIGIRKILGASVFNVWKMLSADFLKLVVISALIAMPVAWLVLRRWLENYEYRTLISWWIFAIALGGTILITIVTISYQALKAAVANPVKSLRSE